MAAAFAFAHALAFFAYLRPEIEAGVPHDMVEYRDLANSLLNGRYGTFQDGEFRPSYYPTPGYPAALAGVYAVLGTGPASDLGVAVVQAGIFAGICLVLYSLGTRIWSGPAGATAAILAATYSPLAYYAALRLTELLSAALVLGSLALVLRAVRDQGRVTWIAVGGIQAWLTLTRSVFQVFIPVLVAIALLPLTARVRGRMVNASLLIAVFVIGIVPWVTFNAVNFGQPAIVLESTGKLVLNGTWSRVFDNRVAAGLAPLVATTTVLSDEDLRQAVLRIDLDPNRTQDMILFVRQWQHDYIENERASRLPPREALAVGRQIGQDNLEAAKSNIERDPLRYAKSRLVYWPMAWVSHTPLRQGDLGREPVPLRLAYWGYQAVLASLALLGAGLLWCRRRETALFVAGPLVILQVAYLPFQVDPRFTLPADPLLLLLASFGVVWLGERLSRARLATWIVRRRASG